MSRREGGLARRQRLAETAAHEPLPTANEWELSQGTPLWAQSPTDEWLGVHVDCLVDDLGEPMRSVVELRIWGRMTFEDIADELELSSRGHAHVLWTRALDKLRDGLEGQV